MSIISENEIIETYNLQPLVSIIVITYNSSDYVLETLESVRIQTYQHVELIIADDCSTDNTIDICRGWINENKQRFVRAELISADKNTGVSGNCNRGTKMAQGKWVKLIAGDDILLSECIRNGVDFININPTTQIFASNISIFYTNPVLDTFKITQLENDSFFDKNTTCENQLDIILVRNPIMAPSVFISKDLIDKNNGFDENISFMEDYPFWIKTLKNKVRIDFLPKTTVAYRIVENSISGLNKSKIFNNFYRKLFLYQKEYIFNELTLRQRLNLWYLYELNSCFDFLNLNDKRFYKLYAICYRVNVFNRKNRSAQNL